MFPPRQSTGPLGETSRVLSRIADAALDLLFPRTCAVCRSEGSFLHEGCGAALARLEMPYCSLCANPGRGPVCSWCKETAPAFDGITVPYLMQGAVQDLAYNLKYQNVRASAPELGRLLASHLKLARHHADSLVPVPLHRRRERERGYNQSELLAREASKDTCIPLATDVLVRTKDSPPQVSMKSPEERRRNIEGAFECTGDVAGKRLLLVDDVVTTGSTMSACARPLKAAGAASVWGLALARQA